MHWRKTTRVTAAAIVALVTVIPAGLAQTAHVRAAYAIVTMYAGPSFTPYGGPINAQHTHVVTALRVLADQFQKQTGIHVQFINPAIGAASGNTYPDYNRYMESSIAGGTAPDIADARQGISISQLGWFENLDSAYLQPDPFVPGNKHWKDLWSNYMLTHPEGNGGVLAANGHRYEVAATSNYPFIIIGTFYNKDLWQKAGVSTTPTTWEQWMQQLEVLKKAGISGMAPNIYENKSGSLWPLWSTLMPAFTQDLAKKLDTNHDGTLDNLELSKAIVNGTLSMSDPHMQAPWLQYKRQESYYLPGWNASDIEAAWTAGKVAERYGGFWEIPTEKSNTGIKFSWGFFAPVPITQDTSPLVSAVPPNAPTGLARLAYAPYADGFGIVSSAVAHHRNLDAAIKWLQFITTPQANEFMVNENVVGVPAVVGAHPAPIYNQLNTLPVPNYQYPVGVFCYQMYNDEFIAVAKESVIWLLGQENDSTFFSHIESTITQYAKRFIAESQKS